MTIIMLEAGMVAEYVRKYVVPEESPVVIMKGVSNGELILWGRSKNVESVP